MNWAQKLKQLNPMQYYTINESCFAFIINYGLLLIVVALVLGAIVTNVNENPRASEFGETGCGWSGQF